MVLLLMTMLLLGSEEMDRKTERELIQDLKVEEGFRFQSHIEIQ